MPDSYAWPTKVIILFQCLLLPGSDAWWLNPASESTAFYIFHSLAKPLWLLRPKMVPHICSHRLYWTTTNAALTDSSRVTRMYCTMMTLSRELDKCLITHSHNVIVGQKPQTLRFQGICQLLRYTIHFSHMRAFACVFKQIYIIYMFLAM